MEQHATQRLRVLVAGGSGLVGRALVDALRSRGHAVLLTSRHRGDGALALDFSVPPDAGTLQAGLAGVDVVVNAIGIFRRTGKQDFDAVHVNGPRRLLEAAAAAGVSRLIQVSALGADPGSDLPYFASKGRFDALLMASRVPFGVVVRPSLVFAPDGASTRWFAMLAVLPWLPLPNGGRQRLQPVHLDDLVAVLVALVEADGGDVPHLVEAVGPRPLSLRDYLQALRRGLGARGRSFAVPASLGRLAGRIAGWWPRAAFDADALRMLEAGNTADPGAMARWRGGPLRDPSGFIEASMAPALRTGAWLGWLLPAARWSLAAMWVATACISLWVYPKAASLALLARTGLHGAWAEAALPAAALLDLALGLGILVARWRTEAYAAQLVLVAAYTAIISLYLPDQWAHPFGPVLKNLPLLAMVALLWALDRGHRPAAG